MKTGRGASHHKSRKWTPSNEFANWKSGPRQGQCCCAEHSLCLHFLKRLWLHLIAWLLRSFSTKLWFMLRRLLCACLILWTPVCNAADRRWERSAVAGEKWSGTEIVPHHMKALLDILPPDVWHRGMHFPLCSPLWMHECNRNVVGVSCDLQCCRRFNDTKQEQLHSA